MEYLKLIVAWIGKYLYIILMTLTNPKVVKLYPQIRTQLEVLKEAKNKPRLDGDGKRKNVTERLSKVLKNVDPVEIAKSITGTVTSLKKLGVL